MVPVELKPEFDRLVIERLLSVRQLWVFCQRDPLEWGLTNLVLQMVLLLSAQLYILVPVEVDSEDPVCVSSLLALKADITLLAVVAREIALRSVEEARGVGLGLGVTGAVFTTRLLVETHVVV